VRLLLAAIVIAVIAFPLFGILHELGLPYNQALAFSIFGACLIGLLGVVLVLSLEDRRRPHH